MGMHYICLSECMSNKCNNNNNTSIIYLRVILILLSHLCPGLQNGLLPANFLTITLYALSSLLCIMYVPCFSHPTSFEHYLAQCINYDAPNHALFSSLL